jgi:hypothetical protein
MSCDCCGPSCPSNRSLVGLLVILVLVSLLFGGVGLMAKLAQQVSLPHAAWIPLFAIAVAASCLGLWLGYKQHGRGEPLALGIFGLLVAALGLVIRYPVALFGASIVLAAALWSAMASPRETGE